MAAGATLSLVNNGYNTDELNNCIKTSAANEADLRLWESQFEYSGEEGWATDGNGHPVATKAGMWTQDEEGALVAWTTDTKETG